MIRKARTADVNTIQELVKQFADQELMLPLAVGEIYERLRDFHVAEIEGRIVGTGAIHVTWESLAELRSLAVMAEHQNQEVGSKLIHAMLEDARGLGTTEVFTLTYVPEFFKKFGFEEIDRHTLPHKVWVDCTKCHKFPDCSEVALKVSL